MKAILISGHAKWCSLIMNGEKKIEVCKGTALYKETQKLIEKNGYAEFYVYCKKGKPNLWLPYEYDCFELDEASQPYLSDKPIIDIDHKMNGKVIFKFRCYKVEEIKYDEKSFACYTECMNYIKLQLRSCLDLEEIHLYLKDKTGYAIHISDLEIFDKPKELGEFNHKVNVVIKTKNPITFETHYSNNIIDKPLTKAPQEYRFIEVGGEQK